jgi:hypothetical protein
LPGVGEWTAHYIALRLFREPDAFPAADVGLLRAMADQAGGRPTPADMLLRAEAWRPWRGYAAQHLWTEEAARLRAAARSRSGRKVEAKPPKRERAIETPSRSRSFSDHDPAVQIPGRVAKHRKHDDQAQ